MRKIIITVLFAILVTTASAIITQCYADDINTSSSTTCRRLAGGGQVCNSEATVQRIRPWSELTAAERADIAEDNRIRDQRIAAWEDFCKPTYADDSFGVTRASYAHKGCDFGRVK